MPSMQVALKWPSQQLEILEKAKKLAGPNKFSTLVIQLVAEWLDKQERIIDNNPLKLRYDESLIHAKHWIDSLTELQTQQLVEDIGQIESQEILSKLKTVAFTINKNVDNQSMHLWKMARGIKA